MLDSPRSDTKSPQGLAPGAEAHWPKSQDRNELLSLRLRQASMLMAVHFQRISDTVKLSVSQCYVLQHLCSGPKTVGEVGRLLSIGSGGATRLIDQLEKRGLVRRRRSEIDRRTVHIEITDAGAVELGSGRAMLQDTLNATLGAFGASEQEMFAALLDRLIRSLRSHPAGYAPR